MPRNVVIATGWCDQPAVPAMAHHLDRAIAQVTPAAYRRPDSLPAGGVLIVGASATGVQLADELAHAGRHVVLAVGSHTRLPRRYRGMDIYWWLERIGSLDRTIDEMPDPIAARHEPSLQLVGRPDHRTLDLATLRAAGVDLTGRLTGIDGHDAGFARRPRTHRRRLPTPGCVGSSPRSTPTSMPAASPPRSSTRNPQPGVTATDQPERLDLRARGITSVIWATGHRRTYPWLHLPVLDASGEIRQRRGVTPYPGLYVLGQRFQHYRNSNFIDGVGRDAAFVVDHLVGRASLQTPTSTPNGNLACTTTVPTTTSSSSGPAPPAPPPRCCWPAPA